MQTLKLAFLQNNDKIRTYGVHSQSCRYDALYGLKLARFVQVAVYLLGSDFNVGHAADIHGADLGLGDNPFASRSQLMPFFLAQSLEMMALVEPVWQRCAREDLVYT